MYRGESESLDFKVDQYSFEKATDDEKSELLKDILAFANAWRDSDAYILIGVKEVRGGKSVVEGINNHLNDHELQQFVNGKTQKPVRFRYEGCFFDGKQCGVIHIPIQERPFFLRKKFGKLEEEKVYIRRGSSTDTAAPDEIADMGKKMVMAPVPTFEVHTQFFLRLAGSCFELRLNATLLNQGKATAHEVQINFERKQPDLVDFDHTLWTEKSAAPRSRALLSLNPLHRGDKQNIVQWNFGNPVLQMDQMEQVAKRLPARLPIGYSEGPIDIRLAIFARDQLPIVIVVQISVEEIQNLKSKVFQPVKE